MLKLDEIAAFVAIAEAGSISEAARRMRLSKSVVSERLAEIERRLGTPLLHRTTRKVSLTEDGAAFLERASRIIRDVEEAAADMAERRGSLSGPLRISAPVTFGRLHLGPALFPFLARHPKLEMSLELDDRRVDAASGGFDAVIRVGRIVDSRLVAWRVATSRRVLVASPEYLARAGMPLSIEQLRTHRGVFYTNRGIDDWRFTGPDGTVTVRARVGLRVNNGDLLRDAAVAGLGVAFLPSFIAGEAIKAGSLKVIDVGLQSEEEHVVVAHAEGRRSSAKLRALADWLRTAFGDPPYWDR
jgi:DNA-binding transcriptional LysR family regulator